MTRLTRTGWAVHPMDAERARHIQSWRYLAPYDFYNLSDDPAVVDELTDGSYYALLDAKSQVEAFFCIGRAARVPDASGVLQYEEDGHVVDLGLGLRPGLTGQGRGRDFVHDVMEYLDTMLHPTTFRLTVAVENTRAVTLYRNLGFQPIRQFSGRASTFWVMVRSASGVTGPDRS